MKINDELIACYIEGDMTAEERNFVRKYLREHPEEYEHVLCLMDNDTADYLNEYAEESCEMIPFESSFSDIAYSAAAFAPQQNKPCNQKDKPKISKMNGWYDRLIGMSKDLEQIQ